ncbi:GNAT family N-acetyltransferase [Leeia sp. TBRC 13508]|uniref:L-ornithine N(alpha)-acyltransferase n=1 Tax=Leeia speluncae TaxID=2884804 RepID=A0ABS8D5W6_9NEIS|nr:GNAT family N-acetyltransferase [Leeia speluncae]MCB6183403.1 GNAT family N-acetyltransferase [Leeia speluncae]
MFLTEDTLIHEQLAREVQKPQLTLSLASSQADIEDAQRLRFKVFAEEMGATLPNAASGLDQDIFDPYCDHLLVRDERIGRVVGTYRILRPESAKRIGGYYSETEFDLTRLQHLRNQLVELGRSCVHRDYRSGGVITLLWAGLADYMARHGYDYLIGCASISMADGGHAAASIYRQLKEKHLAPAEWRVMPRCPLPLYALNQHVLTEVPPLIKGYMRAGAMICGEPAWDPDFNTADLPLLLPMSRLSPRYAKHFLQAKVA